jgi:hypothetical protein
LAILGAIGALALAVLGTGCGPESHPNDPRPPLAVEITVSITDKSVVVEPASAGFRADDAQPISQNEGLEEPDANPDQPLDVVFTITNSTDTDTALEIRGGDVDQRSSPIVAQGNGTYKVALPTGKYELTAADIPASKQAVFAVGPLRVSSAGAVLLP